MDTTQRLIAKYQTANQANTALSKVIELLYVKKSLLSDEESKIYRDSLIQRFEVSYDTLWKFLKEFLLDMHGIEVRSPRTVFQECYALKLCNDDEVKKLLKMAESQNITSHIYNEAMAEKASSEIIAFHQLIQAMLDRTAIEK